MRSASSLARKKKRANPRAAPSTETIQATTPTIFSALAADALARNSEELGYQGWIDDTKHELAAIRKHRASPEYRELHRPTNTNAAMGLFGGEPGFEKSHRVWVDPDNPHLKHVFNSTVLAKNIRYARYGYYKREMHMLDIDKLVRHARMLPPPGRLLTDFMFQKVPLMDKDCAAFLRYAHSTLLKLTDELRDPEFHRSAEEMFERMLSTNIPPVEVGVATHTAMIRCCAVAKKWDEGWNQYRVRALEMEQLFLESSGEDKIAPGSSTTSFVLGSRFFDALLELCVACERPIEGLTLFAEFLERGILPQATSLHHVMHLLAMVPAATAQPSQNNAATTVGKDAAQEAALIAQCNDVWGLFEVFGLSRDVFSISARMRSCALLNYPQGALEALRVAHQLSIPLNEQCYHWAMYALRHTPDMGDFILDLTTQAQGAGLSIDYRHVTFALMYCAMQRDGDAAMVVYQQHILPHDMNATAEMLLLLLQAFRRSTTPSVDMLQCAEDAWRRFHRVGSVVDLRQESVEEMMMLCAHLGASATAFSYLKEAIGKGCNITAIMLNAVLKANALAPPPNGSASLAEEIVEMFGYLKVVPSIDTAEALLACHEAHGSTLRSQTFTNALVAYIQGQDEHGKGKAEGAVDASPDLDRPIVTADALLDVLDVPPHQLRRLSADFRLDVTDISLKKHGQTSPLPAKSDDTATVLGRVQPFGPWPGL
jgi:hypothetical protein